MTDLKPHTETINKDFTSLYFALYMDGEWGVQVGFNTLPMWFVNMRKQLVDWQNSSDCCSLATDSTRPQDVVIASYGTQRLKTECGNPFIPLYSGKNYFTPCKVEQVGDFNNDFSTDFFI